ncbi:MAG: arginine--tRNA ligase [Fimbriimonadaceae bacterium]|nr:arginine--tRNA ligase [Fimbriimonadaceae bacterium]
MIRFELESRLVSAVQKLVSDGFLPADGLPRMEISDARQPDHGDLACNFGLTASKAAGKPPREIAQALLDSLDADDLIESSEIAGPGFINFRFKADALAAYVPQIVRLGNDLAKTESKIQNPKSKINVEFVSVNPNGPITVGSGRGAAFGSTLCNVLEAAGNDVHREYYINDGVNSEQMRLFAESVMSFVTGKPLPEKGYKGDYVSAAAKFAECYLQVSLFGAKVALEAGAFPTHWKFTPGQLVSELRTQLKLSLNLPVAGQRNHEFDSMIRICALYMNSVQTVSTTNWLSFVQLEKAIAVAFTYVGTFHFNGDKRVKSEPRSVEQIATEVDHLLYQALNETVPFHPLPGDALPTLEWYQSFVQSVMLQRQHEDLDIFGVKFDTWFSEQSLHESGQVEKDVADLIAKGAADEDEHRTVIKMGKGGKVEDVQWLSQASEVDEDDVAGVETRADATPTLLRQGGGSQSPEGNTLWLRSTKFGDDMDRVLRRKDGRLTYISSDVSYHKDKFNRGNKAGTERATKLITVLGPDHHGYIGRLHAVLAALELEISDQRSAISDPLDDFDSKIWHSPEEKAACQAALAKAQKELEVVIFQIVRFVKEGKPAPMRKRDGNIYSLRDLMSEIGKNAAPNAPEEEQMRIGKDVARFFYLMRSHDTHMDFDLDLAEKQSDENPVYYVQYAHARICSVLRKAEESGIDVDGLEAKLKAEGAGGGDNRQSSIVNRQLNHPRELALIKKILDLPYEVQRCAEDYGVHRLTTFATELARAYHGFYDACRVIQPEEPELTQARLALCLATRSGLRAVFNLLGISAPEKMERDTGTEG